MTCLDPHTGIILTNGRWCTWGVPRHAWLRCCVWWCTDRSLTAQELGKATDWVGTKTLFALFVCAITPRATGLKTLGKFLQPFSLPLLKGEYMRILLYLHWLSHVAVDRTFDWLLHPSAQVCKQTGWQGMMWLVELAWNFSESAVPWTWQGDVWHGSRIYRTGPYSPKQTKDMLVFFCCLTWLFFLHKYLFSARLQNATKPFCGYPAMRRRCNSRSISCTSQRCFSQVPKWISWNFSTVIVATRSRRYQIIDDI